MAEPISPARALRGMAAGLAATAVLSVVIIVWSGLRITPGFDMIRMIALSVGAPNEHWLGWVLHFVVGTFLWGIGFSLVKNALPQPGWAAGLWFGAGAWLLMMLVLMPLVGAGIYGVDLGPQVAAVSALYHGIFGLAIGQVYDSLSSRGFASHVPA